MDYWWAYPYRAGIAIFIAVGTLGFTVLFMGLAVWLEKSFKKDHEGE